jgi:hypothetical protein
VQRISLPYVYEFVTSLKVLQGLENGKPISGHLYMLLTAETALETFLYNSVYSATLKPVFVPGSALLQAIKKLTTSVDKERILDFLDVWSVNNALQEFETVLKAEMSFIDVFLVFKKRGYDTNDLIERAEVLLPAVFPAKVPEAVTDIKQVGRCLAFELPTAAGFHMMRSIEHVLRVYFDVVAKGTQRPTSNNMGEYLRILDENDYGDKKVRACLRQIKDLHRNELIHPEVTLDLDEALNLWGIVQSAISAMLPTLPDKQLQLTGTTAK